MENKNRNIIIGVVLAVLVLGALYFLDFGSSEPKKTSDKKTDGSDTMSKTTDPTLDGKGSKTGTPGFDDTVTDEGVTPAFLLKQYEEWAKYPPHSRPLRKENYDLTEPFVIPLDAVTMVDTPESKEPNGYRCHIQPKTWAVIGDDTMYITLECRNAKGETVAVKVNDHKMYLYKEWDGTKTNAPAADYNDDGKNGDASAADNIITFSWKPLKQFWGQMFLEAEVTYGKESKTAKLTAAFFSSPNKPAEFINSFREAVEDGSLVVYPTINASKAGNYLIEANLKDTSGNFICYAMFEGALKQGSQEVRLLFFGRVLREKEFSGPYLLSNLRGYRKNLPFDPALFAENSEEALKKIQSAQTTEPDKELIYPYKEDYKTNAYEVSTFSTQVWESDEKNKRIEELKAMAQEEPNKQ